MLKPKKGFIQSELNIERLTPIQWAGIINAMDAYAQHYHDEQVKKLNTPAVMPRISHFIDENGNSVNINAGGLNVVLKRDGTHEYFRSYGFAGRMQLTPVYVA